MPLTLLPAPSVMVPSTTLGHMPSNSLTNGHASSDALEMESPPAHSPPSESEASDDASDTHEPITNGTVSDDDAPGEEYEEDDAMANATDSSDDVDAEGEPDGDYDSETPPPARAASSRSRSSTSQESRRAPKRKASPVDDFAAHPELYGLRRSVRVPARLAPCFVANRIV